MPDKMETEARERYAERRKEMGEITEDQHAELIQELFNTNQEFYTRRDVSDYLDNDLLEFTKYLAKYEEWIENQGLDKVLDPVQIMNTCWYIAGEEIPFESECPETDETEE